MVDDTLRGDLARLVRDRDEAAAREKEAKQVYLHAQGTRARAEARLQAFLKEIGEPSLFDQAVGRGEP